MGRAEGHPDLSDTKTFLPSSSSSLQRARQGQGAPDRRGAQGPLRAWHLAGRMEADRQGMEMRWAWGLPEEVGPARVLPAAAGAQGQARLSLALSSHSIEPDRPRWSSQGKQRFPTSPPLARAGGNSGASPARFPRAQRCSCQNTHGLPLPPSTARTWCSLCPHAAPLTG